MRNLVNIIGSAASGGVSSLLAHESHAWELVVFQQGKKPVDAEFNLLQQIVGERERLLLRAVFGSGVAGIPVPATGPGSNVARIHDGPGLLPYLVDGRIVLAGDGANSNRLDVQLSAPPGGTRSDLVFLEVWYAEVQPEGSPESASSAVYTNGGVDLATLTNDLIVIDANESTRRIQLRYRLRVIDNVNTATYPLGMTDPQVLGRGGAGAPLAGKTFTQDSTDTGLWTAGGGLLADGTAFGCVDGYVYAVPICFVARAAGVTTIPSNAYTWLQRTATATNTDMVDGYHASSTPTANTLLPLDGSAKFPSTVIPSTIDADTVDTYHAAAAPAASKLLALDGSAKFPNSVLVTGSGNGLDADTIDGFHAAATPAAGKLVALDGTSKFPNSVLKTGSGQGIDADTVDGYHAVATPAASSLLILDGTSKFPNSVLKTGSGQGLDADKVDGYDVVTSPAASKLLALDGSAKFPNTALKTGSGQGLDADTVDGSHASAFAPTSHSHAIAAGVKSSAYAGVACGTSYTIVHTKAVTVGTTGYHVIAYSLEVANATNVNATWSAGIFVDGVQDTNFPEIVDVVGDFVGYRRLAGGVINLAAGSRTITIRAKCNLAANTVTIGSVILNVAGATVS